MKKWNPNIPIDNITYDPIKEDFYYDIGTIHNKFRIENYLYRPEYQNLIDTTINLVNKLKTENEKP